MRARESTLVVRGWVSLGIGLVLLGWSPATIAFGADGKDDGPRGPIALGAQLFVKEWTPGEPSRHGGDGLGPLYNDTSCVACHNLGGVGGAGPATKNVHLLSATVTPITGEGFGNGLTRLRNFRQERMARMAEVTGRTVPAARAKGAPVDRDPLIALHAGYRDSRVVTVHRYGPERDYESWRLGLLDPVRGALLLLGFEGEAQILQHSARPLFTPIPEEYGHFTLSHSELNPAALYGVGLIDSIPDAAIVAASERAHSGFPRIQGRLSRLSDGRIGRFGWKAQGATLGDFVLTACAIELGLEVPGRSQAGNPRSPEYRARGLDLTQAECNALTQFVGSLPAPIERTPTGPGEAAIVKTGQAAFQRIGCANCHLPKLGPVEGLYSDLLLHDMGPDLSDAGSYGFVPPSSEESDGTPPGLMPNGPLAFQDKAPPVRGPSQSEWRTPPLWGVRDSGPYMHDGRAETLEQAIAFHGGQAQAANRNYFRLSTKERREIMRFLKSLEAPSPVASWEFTDAVPAGVPRNAIGLR